MLWGGVERLVNKEFLTSRPLKNYKEVGKMAFTLAEVLISLVVIGIISAITIMIIQNNAKNTALASQTKHTWSVINNVFKLVQLDYGTPGDNSEIFSEDKDRAQLNREFAKYFNGAIYCANYTSSKQCSGLKDYKAKYSIPVYDDSGSANSLSLGNKPCIILSNGAIIAFNTVKNSCNVYAASGVSLNADGTPKKDSNGNTVYWKQNRFNCGTLTFDVNGFKKPNRFGVDVYQVNIFRNNLGANYWGEATGNKTLYKILSGSKHPFDYKDYN